MATPEAVISHLVGKLPTGRILNLGAGSTAYADERRTVVGVDIERPKTVRGLFVVADGAALPFRDGVFEGALVKDVIEHVLEPAVVLQEVRRVSTALAAMLVTTPRAVPRAVWADPTHVRGFTCGAIHMLMESSGWQLTHGPRRFGALPGAGRLGLVPHLETLLRVPGVGHYFGTNWIFEASPRPPGS